MIPARGTRVSRMSLTCHSHTCTTEQAPTEAEIKAHTLLHKLTATPDVLLSSNNPFASWRRFRNLQAGAAAGAGVATTGAVPPRVIPGLDVLWSPLSRAAAGVGKRPTITRALTSAQVWLRPPVARMPRPAAAKLARW